MLHVQPRAAHVGRILLRPKPPGLILRGIAVIPILLAETAPVLGRDVSIAPGDVGLLAVAEMGAGVEVSSEAAAVVHPFPWLGVGIFLQARGSGKGAVG